MLTTVAATDTNHPVLLIRPYPPVRPASSLPGRVEGGRGCTRIVDWGMLAITDLRICMCAHASECLVASIKHAGLTGRHALTTGSIHRSLDTSVLNQVDLVQHGWCSSAPMLLLIYVQGLHSADTGTHTHINSQQQLPSAHTHSQQQLLCTHTSTASSSCKQTQSHTNTQTSSDPQPASAALCTHAHTHD
jgi:hypothetical protein